MREKAEQALIKASTEDSWLLDELGIESVEGLCIEVKYTLSKSYKRIRADIYLPTVGAIRPKVSCPTWEVGLLHPALRSYNIFIFGQELCPSWGVLFNSEQRGRKEMFQSLTFTSTLDRARSAVSADFGLIRAHLLNQHSAASYWLDVD